eukprot:1136993-Pelagomonas_calceolata.AAC.7
MLGAGMAPFRHKVTEHRCRDVTGGKQGKKEGLLESARDKVHWSLLGMDRCAAIESADAAHAMRSGRTLGA